MCQLLVGDLHIGNAPIALEVKHLGVVKGLTTLHGFLNQVKVV